MRTGAAAVLAAAVLASVAWAFNPPVDTAGGVTVAIGDVGQIKDLAAPIPVTVTVTNKAQSAAKGSVRLKVIDEWAVKAPATQGFSVNAGKDTILHFTVQPGAHSYGTYYPIHAYADFAVGGKHLRAHPILLVKVADAVGYHQPWADAKPEKSVVLPAGGAIALENHRCWTPSYQVNGQKIHHLPRGWTGSEQVTGATMNVQGAERGGYKTGLNMHEPWRTGWGEVWIDIPVTLPNEKCRLRFWTAIRDNTAAEPPSDGVDFRVFAAVKGTNSFRQLFERFSAAKRWQEANVDLSEYRGKDIILRLWQGPGPKNDTTCDSSYWGDPTLVTDSRLAKAAGKTPAALTTEASKASLAAARGQAGKGRWLLNSRAGKMGAAIVDGPTGIIDGSIAFSAADGRTVAFDGYKIEVDKTPLGDWRSEWTIDSWKATHTHSGGIVYDYALRGEGRKVHVQVRVWAQKGGLRLAFLMPGVKRARDGTPRFTKLYLGAASRRVERIYAGFGNVIVPTGPIDIMAGGFQLSTRHAGADFEGSGGPGGSPGLSLVQACNIQPDEFQYAPSEQRISLIAHHDCTMTLVPSDVSAFAAARAFRDIANYKPAAGHQTLLGRMVIDQWGGEYATDAKDLQRAAAYGLTDCLYLQHVWQRWGYDYRLPEVYPPNPAAGSFQDFMKMVHAAKDNGMLFALHDNYIDFYPDSDGFSYSHIIFNSDGRPQHAWYNTPRKAQSYRWLPGAYMPWLEKNLKLVHDNIGATAYFVDVFSAIPLLDYYDQSGRFHTKVECGKAWGHAFDRIRQILGHNAPTISEAGSDALIGHLDAGEADGFAATTWTKNLSDSERIPWHDMVSHGSFILLGGGLGGRYDPRPSHQWGTDDYMSYTVLGGRNPMCDGPCNRRTVTTYYLLHDICDPLERASLESAEFVGNDIHREHTRFGDGGQVWVNRGTTPWNVEGVTLPQYGFIARDGNRSAEIVLRDGIATRRAMSPGVLYVDARPPFSDVAGRARVSTKVTGGKVDGRLVTVNVEWDVLAPQPEGTVVFVHVDHPSSKNGEHILYYGDCDLPVADLQRPGKYEAHIIVNVPDNAGVGANSIRYGLYNPKRNGVRYVPIGDAEGTRIKGGVINVTKVGGKITGIAYEPDKPEVASVDLNARGKMIDFGPVTTNGAFRLLHGSSRANSGDSWWLIPLPGSNPFEVSFDMAALGAKGKTITKIEGVDMAGQPVKEVDQGPKAELPRTAKGTTYRFLNQAFKYRLTVGAGR